MPSLIIKPNSATSAGVNCQAHLNVALANWARRFRKVGQLRAIPPCWSQTATSKRYGNCRGVSAAYKRARRHVCESHPLAEDGSMFSAATRIEAKPPPLVFNAPWKDKNWSGTAYVPNERPPITLSLITRQSRVCAVNKPTALSAYTSDNPIVAIVSNAPRACVKRFFIVCWCLNQFIGADVHTRSSGGNGYCAAHARMVATVVVEVVTPEGYCELHIGPGTTQCCSPGLRLR